MFVSGGERKRSRRRLEPGRLGAALQVLSVVARKQVGRSSWSAQPQRLNFPSSSSFNLSSGASISTNAFRAFINNAATDASDALTDAIDAVNLLLESHPTVGVALFGPKFFLFYQWGSLREELPVRRKKFTSFVRFYD